jgi:hypothetical protein
MIFYYGAGNTNQGLAYDKHWANPTLNLLFNLAILAQMNLWDKNLNRVK